MKKGLVFLLAWRGCALLWAGDFLSERSETYRSEAIAAESEGRLWAARNAWYKYVRLETLGRGAAITPAVSAAQNRLKQIEEKLRPRPVEVVAQPAPEPAPVLQRRPPPAPARLSARELIKKAQTLRENGQLDEALRFYRLAEKAAPASAGPVRAEIEALEKEMN